MTRRGMQSVTIPHYYDIVILPPEPIFSAAIRYSRDIAKRVPSKFVLGTRAYKPHISLFHVAVKPRDLSAMLDRLTALVQKLRVNGSLAVGKISRYGGGPLLPVSNPKWLQTLHGEILNAVNPLRDHSFPNTWHYPGLNTDAHRRNIRRYGSPVVGSMYAPHITLSLLDDEPKRLRLHRRRSLFSQSIPGQRIFQFTPSELTVCQIGPHHSCHRVIARIPFAR